MTLVRGDPPKGTVRRAYGRICTFTRHQTTEPPEGVSGGSAFVWWVRAGARPLDHRQVGDDVPDQERDPDQIAEVAPGLERARGDRHRDRDHDARRRHRRDRVDRGLAGRGLAEPPIANRSREPLAARIRSGALGLR